MGPAILLLGAAGALAWALARKGASAPAPSGGGGAPSGGGGAPSGGGGAPSGGGTTPSGMTPQLVVASKLWLAQIAAYYQDKQGTLIQPIPLYIPSQDTVADPNEVAFMASLKAFQTNVSGGAVYLSSDAQVATPVWQHLGLGAPIRTDGVLDYPTAQALQAWIAVNKVT